MMTVLNTKAVTSFPQLSLLHDPGITQSSKVGRLLYLFPSMTILQNTLLYVIGLFIICIKVHNVHC